MKEHPKMNAYLGDGLTAEWDGYHIKLWCERPLTHPIIVHEVFMDEQVWTRLQVFIEMIEEQLNANAE